MAKATIQDLRAQFTGTSTKSLKKIAQEEDSQINAGNQSEFLPKDEGMNKFRWFPKHPGEEAFLKMRTVHWLPKLKEDDSIGKTTVPNGRIHGGLSQDVIEAYVDFCQANLDASDPGDSKKLKDMTGWQGGLGLSTSWIGYAKKILKGSSQFGLLDINKTVRDGMNKEAIIEDEDEAIEVDPFSGVDDGHPVLITHNSKGKKATDKWKVQLSKNIMPLTDEELLKFSKSTPLSRLPMFNYSATDFEHALEGLSLYDEQNEIGMFETPEFQQIVEEIRAELPEGAEYAAEDTEAEVPVTKPKQKALDFGKKLKKPVVEEEVEETTEGEEETVDDDLPFEPDDEVVEEEIEEEVQTPVKKAAPVVKKVVATSTVAAKHPVATKTPVKGAVSIEDLKKRLAPKGTIKR